MGRSIISYSVEAAHETKKHESKNFKEYLQV